MNNKRSSYRNEYDNCGYDNMFVDEVKRSRKSRNMSHDYEISPKRLKLDKSIKKSKKSKKQKSSKSNRKHHDGRESGSDSYEHQIRLKNESFTLLSEIRKINSNSLISEIKSNGFFIDSDKVLNKSPDTNSEKNSTISTDTPIKSCSKETSVSKSEADTDNMVMANSEDSAEVHIFNQMNFSLDDIILPPEPEKLKKKSPEKNILSENTVSLEKITHVIEGNEISKTELSLDIISELPKDETSVLSATSPEIELPKSKPICKKLPLPKLENLLCSEISLPALKREKHKPFNVSSLPLPKVPNDFMSGDCAPTKPLQKDTSELSFSKLSSKQSGDLIKPSICSQRTKVRNNATWGERCINDFKIIDKVGEGTYGHVFKAKDLQTGELKALKKVRLENEKEGFPITAIREIKILLQLRHSNIVNLCEIVTDMENPLDFKKEKGAFYLVFDYMDHDLFGILESKPVISEEQVASIFKQLLEGISYCHNKNFLHRDIKCSNILINNRGEIKIADFGLARLYIADDKLRPYTNKVITLWYRPPELLLGEECYSPAIDIWSLGCILGELFTCQTMFTASEEMEQLESISKICGVPNINDWPKVNKLPLYDTYKPRHHYKRRIRESYCMLPSRALDLLDWMLRMDPEKRCNAQQALRCEWLRNIDPKKITPPEFPKDRDCHELSSKKRRKLLRQERELKAHKMGVNIGKNNRNASMPHTTLESNHQINSHKPKELNESIQSYRDSSLNGNVSEKQISSCLNSKMVNGDASEVFETLAKLIPNAREIIQNIIDQLPKDAVIDATSLNEQLIPLIQKLSNNMTETTKSDSIVPTSDLFSNSPSFAKNTQSTFINSTSSSINVESFESSQFPNANYVSYDYNHGTAMAALPIPTIDSSRKQRSPHISYSHYQNSSSSISNAGQPIPTTTSIRQSNHRKGRRGGYSDHKLNSKTGEIPNNASERS